jgi:hypothetical protein
MVITQVMLGMMKSLLIDMIYGNGSVMVNSIPCFLMAGFRNGIDFPMRMATTARLCMFYLQALSNMKKQVDRRLLPYIKFLAMLCAPSDYKKFLARIQYQETEDSKKKAEAADASAALEGWKRYILTLAGWWLFGYILNDIVSFSTRSVAVNLAPVGKSSCWVPQLKVIGAWSILWAAMNLPLLYAIWFVEDAVGLKSQLFWSLLIEILAGISNGASLFNFSWTSFPNRLWSLLSLFTPPFLSFIVPVFFLARFYHIKRQSRKNRSGKSTQETSTNKGGSMAQSSGAVSIKDNPRLAAFEKFWREEGRAQLEELAQKHFIVECTEFLKATDEVSINPEGLDADVFKKVFNTYVKAGSAYEINVPSRMRSSFATYVQDNKCELEPIIECRKEILKLLMENLKHYLDLSHIPEFRRKSSASQAVGTQVELGAVPNATE